MIFKKKLDQSNFNSIIQIDTADGIFNEFNKEVYGYMIHFFSIGHNNPKKMSHEGRIKFFVNGTPHNNSIAIYKNGNDYIVDINASNIDRISKQDARNIIRASYAIAEFMGKEICDFYYDSIYQNNLIAKIKEFNALSKSEKDKYRKNGDSKHSGIMP